MSNVRIEAVRALADCAAPDAVAALSTVIRTPQLDANLRLEALVALGQLAAPATADLFVDVLTDPWPAMRAAAFTALARTDRDMFLTVLSGIEPDAHWTVRAAVAAALGTLDAERARPRLDIMLKDADQRVIPAVLGALVAAAAADAESVLIARLAADDPVVRMAAAAGLARLKSRPAVPALVQSYESGRQGPDLRSARGDPGGAGRARPGGGAAAARPRARRSRLGAARAGGGAAQASSIPRPKWRRRSARRRHRGRPS